jgi:hypothetical protein
MPEHIASDALHAQWIMDADQRGSGALGWLLLVYAATSLLHFAHNAAYLADYPNLPPWLSRADVYLAWCAAALLGVTGYVLYRRAYRRLGLLLLIVYALFGFDGLLHYRRAPFALHTGMMNFTIWAEVLAAAALLAGVVSAALRHRELALPH